MSHGSLVGRQHETYFPEEVWRCGQEDSYGSIAQRSASWVLALIGLVQLILVLMAMTDRTEAASLSVLCVDSLHVFIK